MGLRDRIVGIGVLHEDEVREKEILGKGWVGVVGALMGRDNFFRLNGRNLIGYGELLSSF